MHIAHWLCIISIICDVGCVLTSPCTFCELMAMVSQMVTFAVADQLPPDGATHPVLCGQKVVMAICKGLTGSQHHLVLYKSLWP